MSNSKLINYWNKEIHRFNIVNSMMIFFLSIVLLYQIHFWTNGIVLSSPLLTAIILFSSFTIFSYKKWPWMKFTMDYSRDPKDWRWLIVSLLAGSLTVCIYLGSNDTPGDFLLHKMMTLQYLNGSPVMRVLYKDMPGGVVPFIPHSIVAVFTNFSGAYVQHSLIFFLILLSFLIPLVSYKLARQLGFSPGLSLFFSSLIGLYGGMGIIDYNYRIPLFYTTAVQMYMPKVGRNLCLLLFFLFLIICSKFSRSSKPTYNYSINAGILLGLLGLSHPGGFFTGILFIFIIFGVSYRAKFLQKEVLSNLAIALLVGAILASFYYIPMMVKTYIYGGVIASLWTEVFPTNFFLLYGPLPFLGLYAVLSIKHEKRIWMLLSLFTIMIICLQRLILGFVIDVDRLTVFAINYYAPYIFIFLAFLATAGMDNLFRFKKIRYIAMVLMILITYIGYDSAFANLRLIRSQPFDLIPGITKSKIISTFWGNFSQKTPDRNSDKKRSKIINTFITNLFPENGIEKLRFKVRNPTNTLIVPTDPPELAYNIACNAGLFVSYFDDRYLTAMITFGKGTMSHAFSQKQRLKIVDTFYNDLTSGILRKDILSFYDTDMFLSPSAYLVKKFSLLERTTSVQFKGKEYYLYQLQDQGHPK